MSKPRAASSAGRTGSNGRLDPYDDHGHGTHVAGIAAGKPTTSGNAAFGGVAPGASLIGAKVLDSTGYGADADVVSAVQWCAARSDVDVISMSLGSPGSDGSDAGSQAANAAVAAGKVVVAAAGNDGDGPNTISSPGVATDAITVGASSDPSALAGSTDTDAGIYLAGFSSRGPTTNPDAPLKPDVAGPGLSVVSAKAGTTSPYTTMSGTSMATPFVSGVVALGLEADPVATPAQIKGRCWTRPRTPARPVRTTTGATGWSTHAASSRHSVRQRPARPRGRRTSWRREQSRRARRPTSRSTWSRPGRPSASP